MAAPRAPGTVRKRHRPASGKQYTLRRPRKDGRTPPFWRVIDRETGKIAKTYKGEPLDDGGYGTEQQAERELARLNKRPVATWLPSSSSPERRESASGMPNPGAPTVPSSPASTRHKICDFVLCRAPAVLRCEGVNQAGDYCPIHAETRGFRIPERPRPEKPETR